MHMQRHLPAIARATTHTHSLRNCKGVRASLCELE